MVKKDSSGSKSVNLKYIFEGITLNEKIDAQQVKWQLQLSSRLKIHFPPLATYCF